MSDPRGPLDEWLGSDGAAAPTNATEVVERERERKAEKAVYCPKCAEPVVARERRPDGNSTCRMGHKFPTKDEINVDRIQQEDWCVIACGQTFIATNPQYPPRVFNLKTGQMEELKMP